MKQPQDALIKPSPKAQGAGGPSHMAAHAPRSLAPRATDRRPPTSAWPTSGADTRARARVRRRGAPPA